MCGPARAIDFFGLFGSEPAPVPSADALAYGVAFHFAGKDGSLKQALRDVSDTVKLRKEPPPTGDVLVRRVVADMPQLLDALWGAGYYDADLHAEVAGVTVTLDGRGADAAAAAAERLRNRAPVAVGFEIRLGRLFRLRDVRLFDAHTLQPIDPGLLPHEARGLKPGDPARAAGISAAVARIIDHLRSQSRPLAKMVKIAPVVIHPLGVMDVAITLDPGPRAGIGAVTVAGTRSLDPAVVRSYIYLRDGEAYSPQKLADTKKSLAKIEALGGVRMQDGTALDGDGNLPVTALVTERKPHVVGFSALYSTTDGPSLSSYWEDRNLFGGAESLRLDGAVGLAIPDGGATFGSKSAFQAANLTGRLAVTFVKPALGGSRNDLLADVSATREKTDSYWSEEAEATSSIRHRFSNEASIQVGLQAERGRSEDVLGTVDYTLVGVPIVASYDSTDSLLDPTRGLRVSASVAAYPKAFGSSLDLVQSKLQASTYYALDEVAHYVLAGRVALGTLFGSPTIDIPDNMRFFAGGGGSVRGFAYRSLSPVNAAGIPIGGRSLFEASLEARIKLNDTFGIVPFFDTGEAFASSLPDFRQKLYAALGLGLRYYTGIGPIRFDVAVPLDRPPGQAPVAFYVSVGQSF